MESHKFFFHLRDLFPLHWILDDTKVLEVYFWLTFDSVVNLTIQILPVTLVELSKYVKEERKQADKI